MQVSTSCFLIAAGSGALTLGEPNSPAVPRGTASDTLVARFNAMEAALIEVFTGLTELHTQTK